MGIRKSGLTMVAAVWVVLVWMITPIARADNAPTMQLVISQFKVTSGDGQFFTLYNPGTNPISLSSYQLQYFNNNDLTQATSSKIIQLEGTLAPQSYYMVSDGAAVICYALTVNSVSLDFSSTSGFVEIIQLPSAVPGAPITPSVSDYVGWTKSTSKNLDKMTVSNPATTMTNVPTGSNVSWYRKLNTASLPASIWQLVQPVAGNACALNIVNTTTTIDPTGSNPGNKLSVGPQPPSTIISLASTISGTDAPTLPVTDIGLAAPQLTELLPNPDGTGNDDTDEFIELYNSNSTPFDLSGFVLQTGATTKHSYTFPDGTILQPQSFKAFYSSDTGLSLSNSSGMADLLDPFGNTLSQTDAYGVAKDGQAWSLANGTWYWSSQSTPNAANIVKQTATTASKKSKTSASKSKTTTAVKGASTTSAGGKSDNTATTPAPIHPLMLAVVAVLAVGYGVYEYRHDIANKIYEFRRNRRLGRTARV
jgi:hypothetical protein